MRSFLFSTFIICSSICFSQNKVQKQLSAQHITTISINGNQIFNISVSTSKTDKIKVTSSLDGEYQNNFQISINEDNQTLNLSLEHLPLTEIPDDKRNAHKVIAATLQLEIPEQRSLNILSDIGSVDLQGNYKSLYIELLQGSCNVEGEVESAVVNTIDGNIDVVTKNATTEAKSNHGKIILDEFSNINSIWKLRSINGDITVVKPN
ncbi:hypothetical protein [Winogradskyella bathintestinalis]|uniref:Adhesin domain-containing protein n=1 Tax=Winogradskyella bathintestinalis TaxID=3035208 RepID=A0ABT7ZS44_9FLAO|nr:hypothetical protein [Winogradskyella bathintestinalis]MDN3491789.1 hypothetical protein [Winogradskyella bathintestinalis]